MFTRTFHTMRSALAALIALAGMSLFIGCEGSSSLGPNHHLTSPPNFVPGPPAEYTGGGGGYSSEDPRDDDGIDGDNEEIDDDDYAEAQADLENAEGLVE